METVIVGAHGQIAQLLATQLVERGDDVRGVIRTTAHEDAMRELGVHPYVVDIEVQGAEHALARAMKRADAVVFAAGAGPGSDSSASPAKVTTALCSTLTSPPPPARRPPSSPRPR